MPSGVTTLEDMASQFPDTITVSCNRCDRRGFALARRRLITWVAWKIRFCFS
jgi:hypothetical protein